MGTEVLTKILQQCPFPMKKIVIDGNNVPMKYRPETRCVELHTVPRCRPPVTPPGTLKEKRVQTDIRETEIQTVPFTTEVYPGYDNGLEILTLAWMSWDHGLPAGMHEVEIIERARQKRCWMANLPDPVTKDTSELKIEAIEKLELNEFAFREEEIEFINRMRMELAEELLRKRLDKNKKKLLLRMTRLALAKNKEITALMIRRKKVFNRDIRRLCHIHQKDNLKYHTWDVVEAHMNRTSELWAPLMRFGENPKRYNEQIPHKYALEEVFDYAGILSQKERYIPPISDVSDRIKRLAQPKGRNKTACNGFNWTEAKLKRFYEELKAMRKKDVKKPLLLRQLVETPPPRPKTPEITGIDDSEDDLLQASLLLQKIIRGRTVQTVMLKGRVLCQDLINELKSTHCLQKHLESEFMNRKREMYTKLRDYETKARYESRKQDMLLTLEGMSVANMLDYLSNELLRLQDERRTHAMALLAYRERVKREATEAGRRQKEEIRRKEHDEMFKQILKVHQNSVDMYLEDIVLSSKKYLSERQAREYINKLAIETDKIAKDAMVRGSDIEELEIVGDLVHNYALPQAEKEMLRQRMKAKQKNYLVTAHDLIFGNIETLSKGERDSKGYLKVPSKTEITSQDSTTTSETTSDTFSSSDYIEYPRRQRRSVSEVLKKLFADKPCP